jgi:hypothetical protein
MASDVRVPARTTALTVACIDARSTVRKSVALLGPGCGVPIR